MKKEEIIDILKEIHDNNPSFWESDRKRNQRALIEAIEAVKLLKEEGDE